MVTFCVHRCKNIFDIWVNFSITKIVCIFTPNYAFEKMIVELISKYLESNKRLVVPNLGTFIVKEAGRAVLFSNLIKSDDGVLRSLLVAGGVSELESAAAIDRFVFEVNYRLESSGRCLLSGFGELKNGANGTISFTYKPSVEGDNLDGNVAPRPATQPAPKPAQEPKGVEAEPKVAEKSVDEEVSIDVVPRREPAKRVAPEVRERGEREAAPRRAQRQDDYVKGLRYGKGRKVVTGREGATSRKSSKSDIIMKIAIFAAVLAILAMAYGVYNEWRTSRYDEPFISNSDIYDEEPATAAPEMRNPDLDYITPKQN